MIDSQVKVDAELIAAINAAVPCQWYLLSDGTCPQRGAFLIVPRDYCACGGKVRPYSLTLCRAHKEGIITALSSGEYGCPACLCRIKEVSHIIKSVVEL